MVSNNTKNLDIIFILQKKCIRILNSVSYNGHTNPLFVENKIVKFPDIITKNQLLFVHQLINNILPHDLNCLFTYTTDIHSHNTRIPNTVFFIPQISSTNFGNYSLKFKVPYVWNNFSKAHPDVCNQQFKSFKRNIHKYFLDKYINEI